jgi:hypothetical protein
MHVLKLESCFIYTFICCNKMCDLIPNECAFEEKIYFVCVKALLFLEDDLYSVFSFFV